VFDQNLIFILKYFSLINEIINDIKFSVHFRLRKIIGIKFF